MAALCTSPRTTQASNPPKHGPIPWSKSLEAALKASEKTRRPVMVDFWADWCGPCKAMLATTWKDKKVVQKAKQFVPVLIDTAEQPKVAEKYWIDILPTVLFLDAKGRVILRSMGAIPPEKMVFLMEEARRKLTS